MIDKFIHLGLHLITWHTSKKQNNKNLSLEAMKKISQSSVLISGMNGAGVEIGFDFISFGSNYSLNFFKAKNVILSGIHVVTIHDNVNTKISDLSTQVRPSTNYLFKE